MTELAALAERIEQAEGPSRELDEAIERAVGTYNAFAYYRLGDNDQPDYVPTPYTASLDAAMTLVPEGIVGIHLWQTAYGYECTLLEHERAVAGSSQCESRAAALAAASLRARGPSNG